MLIWATLLGCGGEPSVTINTAGAPDAPMPGNLAEVIERDIQPGVLKCYKEVLAEDEAAAGAVSIRVQGSHGILQQELSSETAPPGLVACAEAPLQAARVQRSLGDGPTGIAFSMTMTFSPED